jgi:ATP-dependent DNA ligase
MPSGFFIASMAATALQTRHGADEGSAGLALYKLGLEGSVSTRKDSLYGSGRSPHWIKSKNPNAPPVKREAEEDCGKR